MARSGTDPSTVSSRSVATAPAGQVVKDLAKNIKGGGGGQPFFATAGGSDASGLDAALAQGRELLG